MPLVPIPSLLEKSQLWGLIGFVSSAIGLIRNALSSPFKHVLGGWNFWKIFLYSAGSFIICSMVLYAKKWKLSRSLMLKAHTRLFDLMLSPDVFGLISCVALAMLSFSLSRQINLGFEVDLLNFFLGCLTVLLMKMDLKLVLV